MDELVWHRFAGRCLIFVAKVIFFSFNVENQNKERCMLYFPTCEILLLAWFTCLYVDEVSSVCVNCSLVMYLY